jgi:DNA-binding winged helix-turn-helix (wHTH) protein
VNNIRQFGQSPVVTERILTMDRIARHATLNGEIIELTATEFDILAFLEHNPHQVCTYTEVIEAVWNDATYFDRHALEVQVSRLRAKLGESGREPHFIETVRGYGYRFRKDLTAEHLASIHYDADLDVISSWVAGKGRLMPPPPPAFEREEDWIAQWLDSGELSTLTSCAISMFDAGLREATGHFTVKGDGGASEKVQVIATIAELNGDFDGVYAEFFAAGFFVSP